MNYESEIETLQEEAGQLRGQLKPLLEKRDRLFEALEECERTRTTLYKALGQDMSPVGGEGVIPVVSLDPETGKAPHGTRTRQVVAALSLVTRGGLKLFKPNQVVKRIQAVDSGFSRQSLYQLLQDSPPWVSKVSHGLYQFHPEKCEVSV